MKITIVHEAAPIADRLNEDACGVYSDGDSVALFVADGASQRLKTARTSALYAGAGGSAGRFAAQTMHTAFRADSSASPRDMILRANAMLRDGLHSVYGDLSASALLQHEPALAAVLEEDPRLLRLALPVCVVTAARIDLRRRQLEYGHAGDTALFLFYADGRVVCLTDDQMGNHDAAALALARQIQLEQGAAHLADVLDDPRVQDLNRRNGLYHNYVDARGNTDRSVGVGVVNGLPHLEAYLQQDRVDLSEVRAVLVCSDGFPWPAPLDETDAARAARYETMRMRIQDDGLHGYYRVLRTAQRGDSGRDRYPRFKVQDDCTGIYVEL